MFSAHFIAQTAGMIASISFFVQYLPQAWLNYQRKSVKGFSTSSIIIKLVGASFLLVNAMWSGGTEMSRFRSGGRRYEEKRAIFICGLIVGITLLTELFLLAVSVEAIPVVCYGLFNVLQHSIFMVQFYLYSSGEMDTKKTDTSSEPEPTLPPGHPHHKPVTAFVTRSGAPTNPLSFLKWDQFVSSRAHYLLWILFPIVPLVMIKLWPGSVVYTNSIKPIGQVMSHIPQVIECIKLRTTLGISMSSQHLNFLGGAMGLLMCNFIPPVYKTTYLIYFNSVFQAISLYAIALYYREPLFPSFGKESPALPPL